MDDIPILADSISFTELCTLLEKLHKNKKQKHEQERVLSDFINGFRVKVATTPGRKNSTFYPVLRLLLPNLERERCAYNLKEKKLGELIVSVALNKQSKEAKRILEFRSVSKNSDSDLPGVAYFVLKNRFEQKPGTLTIGDINKLLDDIANAEVGNKKEIQERVLGRLLKNTNAENAKWFLRLVLKDLKLGMGHTRILSVFHPDAPEIYESCSNLAKVCEDLEDGNIRPLELGVQMFYAISPMLSERLDVTRIADKLPTNTTYQIEDKFDGERFQVHMENQKFEYFSRRGFTYSDNYGKTTDSGSLSPLLKDCFRPSVTSFILDGEMMGWHKEHQYLSCKGLSFDVKKITENSKFRPCFCAFDVLYYNGTCLIGPPDKGGRPLKERLRILDAMFTDVPGVIMHSKRQLVNDNADILEALNQAISEEKEGIVVKDVESYYIVNKRNAGWYKIKQEYTENTMNDLDLVIIGADEAENKKQGRARSFVVACADSNGDGPRRWLAVGRVVTGLTFDEKERVCKLLETNWVSCKKKQPPPSLCFNKETPDFWIEPQNSVALTVRATELIRSGNFGTAYTLRFPRVVSIRDDKPATDVMTVEELNQLVMDKGPVVKLGSKRIASDQMEDGSVEVQVRKKRVAKPVLVAEQFLAPASKNVSVLSKALDGRKVCILNTDEGCGKEELSAVIESHGGKIVANNGPDVWCCIAAKVTPRIRAIIDSNEADIVTPSWILSIPTDSDDLVQLSPLDMLGMRKSTRLKLGDRFDKYGLSYTEEVDEATLRKCFDKMEREKPEIFLTKMEKLLLDQELFGDNNPFSYLRPCNIHIDFEDELLKIKAQIYKASICPIDYKKLTHIVTDDASKVERYREAMENKAALVVTKDWLVNCFEEGRKVSEEEFLIT